MTKEKVERCAKLLKKIEALVQLQKNILDETTLIMLVDEYGTELTQITSYIDLETVSANIASHLSNVKRELIDLLTEEV